MSEKIVKYRLERADKAYQAARILADNKNWDDCINRLYYSCFYAVSALLERDGFSSSKHSGIRSLFNKNYVKTGIITKTSAKFYNNLFEDRQEADYTDLVEFEASETLKLLEQTKDFLADIKQAIADPNSPETK